MKTCVMTTGALFGVLVLVHIWRAIEEGRELATSPGFILLTAASAALSLWALRLVRDSQRS